MPHRREVQIYRNRLIVSRKPPKERSVYFDETQAYIFWVKDTNSSTFQHPTVGGQKINTLKAPYK